MCVSPPYVCVSFCMRGVFDNKSQIGANTPELKCERGFERVFDCVCLYACVSVCVCTDIGCPCGYTHPEALECLYVMVV